MTNYKLILTSLFVVTLIGAGCSNQSNNNTETSSASTSGRIIFSVTDAATNLESINAVNITINKVELQSTQQSWITLSTQPKTYNLMELKQTGLAKLLLDTEVPAGVYNQMRIQVDKVTVAADGKTEVAAKMPSNTIKIIGKIVINADSTSSVLLDFLLDQSLHITGNGQFILLPVIKVDSASDAQVEINEDNSVQVKNGTRDLQITIGTNLAGETMIDFPVYTNLELTSKGIIKLSGAKDAEANMKIDAQKAVDLAITSGQITSVMSVELVTKNNIKVWRVVGLKGVLAAKVDINSSTGVVVP